MPLEYLFLRLIRHFMPGEWARTFLRKGWIIRPGLETSSPEKAARRYLEVLTQKGWKIDGKRILVFGYGGNFAIACHLLAAGASFVLLCEKDAPVDTPRNLETAKIFPEYLSLNDIQVQPNPRYIQLLEGDIRKIAREIDLRKVDLVLSSSVYEHLDDVRGINAALSSLCGPDGAGLHFIDIRDHYFKYPFEMLTYSEKTWRRWLDPGSHLNRWRLRDYRDLFQSTYRHVDIEVIERDLDAFNQTRFRIRPQFISGNPDEDSATILACFCKTPIR